MKIVFVLPDMPGGGTERVVAMLANEYVKRNYEVAILLFAGNQVVYPLDEKIEVVVLGKASGGNPLVRIKRIINMRKYYKANKGCYLFSFSVMGTVFSVISAAGIPYRMLVSERNDPTKMSHQKLRDWAYRKADKLVLQTEDVKKFFDKEIQKKAVVIPNPVAGDMPELFIGERKKRIAAVARLQPQKNHKLLIDAFAEFLKDYPNYELHLFGVGELENTLKQQVNDLQIDDKVIFRGFCDNVTDEIKDYMMFVSSSDYEGISNSMIEALAMGVPVVATDCPVGGARMCIDHNESGILVPVQNVDALTSAMKKIASDSMFRDKLSKKGIKIREKYSLQKIADQFLQAAGIE